MQFKNNYWYFESVLSPRFCDDLIEYGNLHKKTLGLTGNFNSIKNISNKQIKNIQKKRKSSLVWLDDAWIYKEIIPYIDTANKNAEWNFDIEGAEACQFTEYGVGEYYGWHYDMHTEHGKKIRKLSVTCNLSNPEDYEGGDLEFSIYNPDKKSNLFKCTQIKPRGSIVVFPSFVWHRVKPVTRGKRYSLVIWNQGDKFK
jgi:PKHD-type hydroxylase|tara:strand:+ start:62 stop:658 length:597 start_codon:yes stop_codon:yes gene_type:complete